uniref:Uncharacterized protein LOC111113928 n=1 Tax=Crassostrea virginica TaxID=6565 RepID=A0A8B8BX27_CRAVI|nr:uncharacterized protein LOC111113928 [Crassostrea virginica]
MIKSFTNKIKTFVFSDSPRDNHVTQSRKRKRDSDERGNLHDDVLITVVKKLRKAEFSTETLNFIDFNTLIVNTYQKISDWFKKKRAEEGFQWGLGNRATKRGHLRRPSPTHLYVTGSPLKEEMDGGTASSEWEICLSLYIKRANQIC